MSPFCQREDFSSAERIAGMTGIYENTRISLNYEQQTAPETFLLTLAIPTPTFYFLFARFFFQLMIILRR